MAWKKREQVSVKGESQTREVLSMSLTDWLSIIFGLTTLFSLYYNIVGYKDRQALENDKKAWREPLRNTLAALFNDIQTKTNNTFFVYNALFLPNNPHKTTETLRWECGLIVQTVNAYLQGFQKTLSGALLSIDPDDTDGKKIVDIANYGLSDDEKELRRRYFETLLKQFEAKEVPESTPDSMIVGELKRDENG